METIDQYKKNIIESIPALSQAIRARDHLCITSLLRHFAYENIVWSNDGLNMRKICEGDLSVLPLAEIFHLFGAHEIGVLCGGSAVFLCKILALFGYDATTYNYGIPGVSTHVVTLVTIPTQSGNTVVAHDATFDCCLSTRDTKNHDFFQIMRDLRAGKHETVAHENGTTDGVRPIYFSDTEEGRHQIEAHRASGILVEEPFRGTSSLSLTPYFCAHGDLGFQSSYIRRNGMNIVRALSRRLDKPVDGCSVFELLLFPIHYGYFPCRENKVSNGRPIQRYPGRK